MQMRECATGLTDVGLQREHNEDSFLLLPAHHLYVVADGMGGHQAGDVASKLATSSVAGFFDASARDDVTWPFETDLKLSDEENLLVTAVRLANRAIFQQSLQRREQRGMGTTLVGVLFGAAAQKMYIAHVGDSRAYRIRGGAIRQITRDHSLVNDYLSAMPELTEEQASELPKNVITRALGMQSEVEVELSADAAAVGDVYLLCSDGLSGMVDDDEMLDIVTHAENLEAACVGLVRRANENGGDDNVTVVLVSVCDD